MTSNERPWRLWPALERIGRSRRWRLQCDQGIHGRTEDGERRGWVATSAGFDADSKQRAEALYLGAEDDPQESLIWHGTGHAYQAVLCRPAPVGDGSASVLLERRVLECRNPRGLPAALLAFAMLPELGGGAGDAGDAEARSLFIDESEMENRIETGCRELASALDLAAMSEVYARLVADPRYVVLPEPHVPLTAAAFATLLLPLHPDLADRLSMLSRLPSRDLDRAHMTGANDPAGVHWHLLGLGHCPPERLPAPSAVPDDSRRRLGEALARAVTNNDPTAAAQPLRALPSRPEPPARAEPAAGLRTPTPGPAETGAPSSTASGQTWRSSNARAQASTDHQLRIWGAPSSGKTIYLAYLFLKHRHGGDPRWRIDLLPPTERRNGNVRSGGDRRNKNPEEPEGYLQRLEEYRSQNRFPKPTASGTQDIYEYRLTDEQTGDMATISMEDRAGQDYLDLDDATVRLLSHADGSMLLLDPDREGGEQDVKVEEAFIRMKEMGGYVGKNPRPLAVCVSKSDELIHSVDEYRRALAEPGQFLARAIGRTISEAVQHHFANYRIFALSAVGLRIVQGTIEPGVFYDEQLVPRPNVHTDSINLIEPLTWLLAAIKQ